MVSDIDYFPMTWIKSRLEPFQSKPRLSMRMRESRSLDCFFLFLSTSLKSLAERGTSYDYASKNFIISKGFLVFIRLFPLLSFFLLRVSRLKMRRRLRRTNGLRSYRFSRQIDRQNDVRRGLRRADGLQAHRFSRQIDRQNDMLRGLRR
jgi:hypothetical protein